MTLMTSNDLLMTSMTLMTSNDLLMTSNDSNNFHNDL